MSPSGPAGGSPPSLRFRHSPLTEDALLGAPPQCKDPPPCLCSPPPSRDWTASAACGSRDPDELFVTGAAQNRVKAVCFNCPVRTECLADALDNSVEFGVWGGHDRA